MKLDWRFISRCLGAISGGYLAFALTQGIVFERFLTAAVNGGTHQDGPSITALQDMSARIALIGAALGLGVVEAAIRFNDRGKPHRDAIRLLYAQMGRRDLGDDQRAAIAYVIQDLEDDFQ
jgi:hypothetical protein